MLELTMPQLGESVSEGTVLKWLVREGDIVSKDQPLLEVGTDKADTELPAPAAGRIAKLVASEGATIPVHGLLCQIEPGSFAAPSPQAAPPAQKTASAPLPAPVTQAALATPSARKAALEHAVPLAEVHGSGGGGRITRSDVLRSAATPSTTPAPAPVANVLPLASPKPATAISASGYGSFKLAPYRPSEGDQVIPFTRRRRITADHMTYSKQVSPHVLTVAEVDLHKASRLREAHKTRYKQEGLNLTLLAFAAVATARALREHSALNARVLDDAYVVFKEINLGVAIDSPDGLVVPVIRRADELGVRGVSRSIDELAKRARTGKITADDLSGATFSISNPGLKGNLFGGAIISQPNVGILRMGEIQKRVVVVTGPDGEDQMAIHPVMYIALSYDHRVVDGVAANAFLWRITELLEQGDFEL